MLRGKILVFFSRVSSLGCESGYLRCSIVDCDSNCVLRVLSTEYENPISSVQLFTLRMPEVPLVELEEYIQYDGNSWSLYVSFEDEFVKKFFHLFSSTELTFLEEKPEVNLLVTNTLFHSEVFMYYHSLSTNNLTNLC